MLASQFAPTATTLIRMDHTHVLLTYRRYHADTPSHLKRGLVDTICLGLEVHAQLEEEIFYPALRAVLPPSEVMDDSVPEHDTMRRLIGELRALPEADDAARDALLSQLMREVLHHVADEETVLLPQAERLLAAELRPLGARMLSRRAALLKPRVGELASSLARSTPPTKWLLLAGAALAGVVLAGRAAAHHRPG